MGGWATQRRWLHERTVESLGGLYEMHWPGKQPSDGARPAAAAAAPRAPRGRRRVRPGRRLGAAAVVRAGLVGSDGPLRLPRSVVVPGRPRGGPGDAARASRCTTCRRTRSSRSPGRARSTACSGLATSDLDTDPGRIVYTVLANERGGIEMDPTITRLARGPLPRPRPDADPAADGRRCCGSGLPRGRRRHRRHVRVRHAARRRPAVARAAGATDRRGRVERGVAVPPGAAIEVARAHAWAFRVSFTGELGWELLVPTELRGRPVRADRRGRRRPRSAPAGSIAFDAPAWSAASGRGDTTSARSTTRSRRARVHGLAQEGRRLRRREALERLRGVAEPGAAPRLRPDRPRCCGTASRCSVTASASATSRAPRSRRPSTASAGLAWSTALDGDWCVEIAGEPVPAGSASTRSTTSIRAPGFCSSWLSCGFSGWRTVRNRGGRLRRRIDAIVGRAGPRRAAARRRQSPRFMALTQIGKRSNHRLHLPYPFL